MLPRMVEISCTHESKCGTMCSTSLVVSKVRIKPTMHYHISPITTANIRGSVAPDVGKDVGKQEVGITRGEDAHWHLHFEKRSGNFWPSRKCARPSIRQLFSGSHSSALRRHVSSVWARRGCFLVIPMASRWSSDPNDRNPQLQVVSIRYRMFCSLNWKETGEL